MKPLALVLALLLLSCQAPILRVTASKSTLLANGYDNVVLNIQGPSAEPVIECSGNHRPIQLVHRDANNWDVSIRSTVMPGAIRVKIQSGTQQWQRTFRALPQTTDSAQDGTPDFQRLDESADREFFRTHMAALAETEYFQPNHTREITDCSALVRYAYREALRNPAGKYSFPHTPLGPRIFRVREGPYLPSDLAAGAFAEFADAHTLQQFNMFFVSRDVTRAQPGDIFFYRRKTTKGISYHSMIFIGPSQVKPDSEIYVVYHTGPDGTNNGEIRRINLTQLLQYPDPQWHAIAANPQFLGVYRWNILKAIS